MIYLVIAVLCSVAVSVLLKILRQRQVDIRQTIVAGYPVAFLLTWWLLNPEVSAAAELGSAWGIIFALGILLPLVFVILGRAIESVGIIATDAAQRLSLIIPIVAAFLLFGEVLTTQRVIGVAIGFLALGLLVYRSPNSAAIDAPTTPLSGHSTAVTPTSPTFRIPTWGWLLGVWLGYGVIDILFKQVAKQGAAFPLTLFLSFGLAALLLLGYLISQRVRWQPRALLAGLLLGGLNMGNIYAYVRAHQTLAESPSMVFTGMNVGVIAVATLVGIVLFKETLSRINRLGLLFAIICVAVLFLA
ncbi:EamA/RhaT family transporter [Psychrobacter arenosus]|uniref:EamA/RhaT family transporter n=1 Tax=Psychrobacter arenosus TaxID=256326 RepID=UPI00191A607B|nr:EamA/RhaT family transporter [Psychrobacter arenosus]